VHRIATLENTIANLKSGIRFIRKSPSFSAAVIFTLALGIGANTAVFSAINAILLRPLPFPNGDELMVLHQNDRKAKKLTSFVAPIRLEDWNRLNTTFQALSGYYKTGPFGDGGCPAGESDRSIGGASFSRSWGVSPALGPRFHSTRFHSRGRALRRFQGCSHQ
jgi:putative ABC transport system permease protein